MSAIAGRVLLIPKGAYDANVTYHMLDVVSYGGNSYVAKQTTAGNTPSADNAYWMLLSAGSAVASINDIGDVLITSPTDGQVLKYNATTQKWENGQDTGGLLPHLIIISEDGESEVKAVKGSTEIIATRTSAGHYECDVPEFGTWTIHAVLNGDDATVNLVVDTVKVYTVDDSHFHADITVNFPVWEATCNLAGQGESYYATSDPYTFTVHQAGTYTITVTQGENTYTDTVEVTATGQTFSKIVPSPADASIGDINFWLWYGGIDNTQGTYSSLADILADTTALSTLMANQNAVDYLVRSTSWTSSVTASEDAMTYIGLNNYCANTLLADATWCNAICNSEYVESVLNVKVPVMTSYTNPEGVASASSENSAGRYAWYAFDNVLNNNWVSANNATTNQWIRYKFTTALSVKKVEIYCINRVKNFIVQCSNDDFTNDIHDVYSGVCAENSVTTKNTFNFVGTSDRYMYWQVLVQDIYASAQYSNISIDELQFYGREDV